MVKDKEYFFSIDKYNKPSNATGNSAIGTRLLELIMMNPGDDPLHPDMGVGIKNYRYSLNELSELERRIENQIKTYLPMYQGVEVKSVITQDKLINIEIRLNNTIYLYNSSTSSKPITLSDI